MILAGIAAFVFCTPSHLDPVFVKWFCTAIVGCSLMAVYHLVRFPFAEGSLWQGMREDFAFFMSPPILLWVSSGLIMGTIGAVPLLLIFGKSGSGDLLWALYYFLVGCVLFVIFKVRGGSVRDVLMKLKGLLLRKHAERSANEETVGSPRPPADEKVESEK